MKKSFAIGMYATCCTVSKLGSDNWSKFREHLQQLGYSIKSTYGEYYNHSANKYVYLDTDANLIWVNSKRDLLFTSPEHEVTYDDVMNTLYGENYANDQYDQYAESNLAEMPFDELVGSYMALQTQHERIAAKLSELKLLLIKKLI